MSTDPRSTVVGVFRDRTMAEQALDALSVAGFNADQIRYSGSSSSGGGFLKNLFTGQNTTNDNFIHDLADIGLPDEETSYYANEYHNGHSIVAVNTRDNPQEAWSIMQSYGAYNNNSAAASVITQPINHAQQSNQDFVNANPSAPQQNMPLQTQSTPTQTVQRPPVQENRQIPTPDKLQELQAQYEATQRQLQDAQAQLQAAKQREAQMQAARQQERQFQETQKRLQEMQAQLQATLAELRSTQARIGETNQ